MHTRTLRCRAPLDALHEQFGHLELLADAARLDTLHRVRLTMTLVARVNEREELYPALPR